jgi:hypothetical protein
MWGDERDFIRAADESWGNEAPLANEIEAKDGHSYLLTMLVHNNAAPNLDLAARGVAGGIFFDEQESSEVKVRGSVKADNCGMSPNGNVGGLCQFIDEVRFWSESPFSLRLIPGSAVYTTNGESFDLPDTVVNAGATLGDVEPTGDVIGGTSVSGYLTLRVIAVF